MVIFHSYVKLPEGISNTWKIGVASGKSNMAEFFSEVPWVSYISGFSPRFMTAGELGAARPCSSPTAWLASGILPWLPWARPAKCRGKAQLQGATYQWRFVTLGTKDGSGSKLWDLISAYSIYVCIYIYIHIYVYTVYMHMQFSLNSTFLMNDLLWVILQRDQSRLTPAKVYLRTWFEVLGVPIFW